jgi:hypothetical protein
VKREPHHAAVVTGLDLVSNINQDRFGGRIFIMVKDNQPPRLFHHHESVGEGNRQHFHRIDEGQIGEGVGKGPTARGRAGSSGRKRSIQVFPDGLRLVKTTGLGVEGWGASCRQPEQKQMENPHFRSN